MPANGPTVSVVVPCRNEADYLAVCLDSIIQNHYPKEQLEIIVVDGCSEDGSWEIAQDYARKYPFVRVFRNHRRTTPTGLNLAIEKARGKFIVFLGAHATISPTFLERSVYSLEEYRADCVGGRVITIPARDTVMSRAIAYALSTPFGMGNSYFRIGSKVARSVDTVAYGCYRREVFERIGRFDENLARNQDDEFNLRLRKKGGKIILDPDIVSFYRARDSIGKVWSMFFQYGLFKPLLLLSLGRLMTWRQIVPPLFVVYLLTTAICGLLSYTFRLASIVGVIAYLTASVGSSVIVVYRQRDVSVGIFLPVVYAAVHFAYGIGYLTGLVKFALLRKTPPRDIRLTR